MRLDNEQAVRLLNSLAADLTPGPYAVPAVRLVTSVSGVVPQPVREHWQFAGRFGEYLVWETDDMLNHVSRRADDFYAGMTGVITESEIIAW